MNLKRIDHLALVCADTARSRNWYCEVLGMEWVHRDAWNGNPVFLRLGETCLALFQAGSADSAPPARKGIRVDHFAFLAESRDSFENAREELAARGIEATFEDHDLSHSIYFPDPDGHIVEITTYDVG